MQAELDTHATLEILEQATGVVMPVYFHAESDPAFATQLLRATVRMFVREVADPQMICLSVDGGGLSQQIAQAVAQEYGTRLVHRAVNQGKLASVRDGVSALLADERLRYLAVVDCDGDHFANELLNFVRCAEQIRQLSGQPQVMVLGERRVPARALGFLRGEQEELADRILLDALHYHAVQSDKPLPLNFATVLTDVPDFHSGYKFFDRLTAAQVFTHPPDFAGGSADAYYRHACEAVMTVEALLSGALLATVNRRTFDEQPISSFARLERAQLAADMIIWPCKRLGVPGHFVAQWLTNHLPRLALGTLVPQGRAELITIRRLVLQAYDLPHPTDDEAVIIRPRFL